MFFPVINHRLIFQSLLFFFPLVYLDKGIIDYLYGHLYFEEVFKISVFLWAHFISMNMEDLYIIDILGSMPAMHFAQLFFLFLNTPTTQYH